MKTPAPRKSVNGFTMIEMLIVIAVIGVMSAMVISAFSGAAQDTRRVIARQQQAAVQNAVNAWVNAESSKVGVGLSGARTAYNATDNALEKLALVGSYLEESTLTHLTESTTDSTKIKSAALKKIDQYLALSDWSTGSYPKVELK